MAAPTCDSNNALLRPPLFSTPSPLCACLVCVSGTLAGSLAPASLSPWVVGWNESPFHIAAYSTWDEVWSLRVAHTPSRPRPASICLAVWFWSTVGRGRGHARPWVGWVELHKTRAQPLQTCLFLFSTSTLHGHSFPPQRPGCLPSHFGAHHGETNTISPLSWPALACLQSSSTVHSIPSVPTWSGREQISLLTHRVISSAPSTCSQSSQSAVVYHSSGFLTPHSSFSIEI